MRCMIVGDTHGNAGAVEYKAKLAQAAGCERRRTTRMVSTGPTKDFVLRHKSACDIL